MEDKQISIQNSSGHALVEINQRRVEQLIYLVRNRQVILSKKKNGVRVTLYTSKHAKLSTDYNAIRPHASLGGLTPNAVCQ